MNIIQFLRILWARRWITVLATASKVRKQIEKLGLGTGLEVVPYDRY